MKILVASTNPVKINAARSGFQRMFPEHTWIAEGVSVQSGVSEQPMSDEETYSGAEQRAINASKCGIEADYYVGLEGGIEDTGLEMASFAWAVAISRSGRTGKGRTSTFFLPIKIAELVRSGEELGKADDIVFGLKNSKQSTGAVGILTGDVITRESYYSEAIMQALIPFKNPLLY